MERDAVAAYRPTPNDSGRLAPVRRFFEKFANPALDDDAELAPVFAGAPVHVPVAGAGGRAVAESVPDRRPGEAVGPMPLRLIAGASSVAGDHGTNADAYLVQDGLLVLADGVNGGPAAPQAASLALGAIVTARPQQYADAEEALRNVVAEANRAVRAMAAEHARLTGMATTLDAAVLTTKAGRTCVTTAHVGNATMWLVSPGGQPQQLTTPHSFGDGPLLRCVGLTDALEPDIVTYEIRQGDRLIMATDGAVRPFGSEGFEELVLRLLNRPVQSFADVLVAHVVRSGGTDDATVLVADVANRLELSRQAVEGARRRNRSGSGSHPRAGA